MSNTTWKQNSLIRQSQAPQTIATITIPELFIHNLVIAKADG